MYPVKYDTLIQQAVLDHLPPEFDWRLYKAQLWVESNLNPMAVSPVGARGLAQIMPGTWNQWAPRTPQVGSKDVSPFDAKASIFTGAAYMRWLWNQWSTPRPLMDRWALTAASYNSGLGDLLEAQKVQGMPADYASIAQGLRLVDPKGVDETVNYVKKILHHFSLMITEGK